MKLRYFPVSLLGALSLWASALAPVQADPAVYINGELRMDAGIVHLQGKDQFYKDIRMLAMPDGSLKLVNGSKRRLALLDELELNVVYGGKVEVELTIGGYLGTPCSGLEPTAISRQSGTIHVLVAETPPDPLALCAQVLQPFSLVVQVDTTDLEPGEYTVLVNNEPMEFTIEDLGV